jgi:hypothetical protein
VQVDEPETRGSSAVSAETDRIAARRIATAVKRMLDGIVDGHTDVKLGSDEK